MPGITDASKYEILYDLPEGEYNPVGVEGVRTRTIRAGDSLEVESYPLLNISTEARREHKARKSSSAQEQLNRKNACKRLRRLAEANFAAGDHMLTVTYRYPANDRGFVNMEDVRREFEENGCPEDEDQVRRDFRNFMRAVRRAVKRLGEDPAQVKYIYVIESTKEPRDEDYNALPAHYHIHIIISAPGLGRSDIENLWKHGYANTKRLDFSNNGLAALSKYLTKQRRCLRRWEHSRNLKEPDIQTSDRRISRRRAAMIARDVQADGREILEKIYPGYRVEEVEVKYSDFVAGAYIYARLRKRRQ